MSQIKFRGKTQDSNEWAYGFFYEQKMLYGSHATIIATVKEPNDWDDEEQKHFHIKRDTLGQFSGLISKTGVDAYYGDIIEFQNTEGHRLVKSLSFCVKTQSTMIGENWTYNDLCNSGFIQPSVLEFDIIGNVYDNPELLK